MTDNDEIRPGLLLSDVPADPPEDDEDIEADAAEDEKDAEFGGEG